jgi:hypothetical protein
MTKAKDKLPLVDIVVCAVMRVGPEIRASTTNARWKINELPSLSYQMKSDITRLNDMWVQNILFWE